MRKATEKICINIFILFLMFFIAGSLALFAQKKIIPNNKNIQAQDKEQANYPTVTWQEGENKRQLKIIPDMIAEFTQQPDFNKSVIKKNYPGSSVAHESSSVRIWKVGNESLKTNLKQGNIPTSLKKNYSPVFTDSSGRKRALPGNIIVAMDKSWDSKKVNEWAKGKNLAVIKQISSFSNTYLIETPAGIESLNISNNLANEPGVLMANPDWWIEVHPR